MADRELPTWGEIERQALRHLHAARNEMGEVRDWLNSDLRVPLSDADVRSRREVLRITGEVKQLIDQAKRVLHGN
jgi:hypothetical protein